MRAADAYRLIRPINGVLMGIIVVVGSLVASRWRPPPWYELLEGALVGFLLNSASMVLNDIVDVEADRINAPWRPIPSGAVTLSQAWALFYALAATGLGLAAYMGLPELEVAAAAAAAAIIYDIRGKRLSIVGNMLVAFTGVAPMLYGGIISGGITGALGLESAMIFLMMISREVTKGISDVEGDMKVGARTLAIQLGPSGATAVAAAFMAAAVALSPLPPLLHMASPVLYSPFVALTDVIFLYETTRLLRDPSRETALRAKDRELVIGVPVALLGFALGAL